MAYTEAQWNKFQSLLPAEERTSYLDYLKEADPASYNRLVNGLANLKADAQEPAETAVVDERTKIALAKADKAAQIAAARKSALAGLKTDSLEPTTKVSVSALEGAAAKRAAEAKAIADKAAEDERILTEAKTTAERNTKVQAALARFRSKQPLSAEDKALLNLGADFEYPLDASGNPVIVETDNEYTTVDGVLLFKGNPYSGTYEGKEYVNGKVKATPPSGGSDYTTVDGVLLFKGKPYSGTYEGKEYVNGKVKASPPSGEGDYTTVDGVLLFKGKPYTGNYNGKEYKDGKLIGGGAGDYTTVDGVLLFKGKPYTGEYNGVKYVNGKATTTGGVKNAGYWTDPETGLLYKDDVLVEGDYNGFTYKAGFVVGKPGATEVSRVTNADGSITVTYSDGTTKVFNKVGGGPDATNVTLVSTYIDDATGDTIGYFSDGSKKVLNKGNGPVRSEQFKDAYALLKKTFSDYDLDELVPIIQDLMDRGVAPEQATLELRASEPYRARFKGNTLRLASGRNALSESVYLATENAYNETLKAYGQQNYFGSDRKAKQAKMAEIIGNDISSDEFRSRVDLAVARVQNADPTIKKLLKEFYPSLNDADLVGYFLNPTEGLPKLTEKVTSAEIGSAFLGQGLAYTQQRSAELAQYGLDRAGALKGAAEIKQVLPESQKLGDIYGESGIVYNQRTGEEEFIKNNQDAATKRKRLASMERGSFSGSAGNAPGAYSTGYLKKSSTAGLI